MAHFAQLDENNVVVQVIVVKNSEILDENGNESEEKGIAFCQALLGMEPRWVQTSYNGNFRARYAVIGHTYYPSYDAFIAPKPRKNPSFIIDPIKFDWVPPVPRPTDDVYKWNEDLVAWLRVPAPYPSWVMQGEPLTWVAPVPRPDDGGNYRWDESSLSWILVTQP